MIVGLLSWRELAERAFRHVHLGDQRIEVRDLERRVVDVDGVADLDVAGGDHAGDRRTDLRVAEFELRRSRAAFSHSISERALSTADSRPALAAQQLERALILALELAEVRFGLLQLEAQPIAIETGEHLAGLHASPSSTRISRTSPPTLATTVASWSACRGAVPAYTESISPRSGPIDLHGNARRGRLCGVLGRALAAAIQREGRNGDQQRNGR